MRTLIISIFTMLLCVFVNAQELPKIVPPSPEASALSEFTNVPVSHYTGLPNISVPIYTIQQKGITIPINLSYHARGVRVSETAPRTGMGWSLVYGGSISRQVRGKADESPNNGYLVNKADFMNFPLNKDARNATEDKETSNPGYDFYPDQFSFKAGGTSGKFVLNYVDGEPIIQSFGDVEVSYTRENGFSGKIDSFVIVDSNGNKYYYGKSKDGLRTAQDYQNSVGMSISYTGNVVLDPPASNDEEAYSSWKLMDIETSYGELISYYYEGEFGANSAAIYYRKAYDKHSSYSGSTTSESGVITSESATTNSLGNMNNIQKINSRISKVFNYEKQLTRIEFNQGRDKIEFIKSQNKRADFEGYSLDKISIYNDNKKIKSFNLNYSYTTSTDQSNVLSYFIGNPLFSKYLKRMFLSSIQEEAVTGETIPPYTFTYDSTILPSTFSSRQDYWGYYNGAENNGPFTRAFDYGNYKPDRRVDTLKSEAGILKQITYPTGGMSKFTYEHNKGKAPLYLEKLKLPIINPGVEGEVEIILTKNDFAYTSGGYTPYQVQIPSSTGVTYKFECLHFKGIGDTTTPDCLFNFTVEGGAMNLNEDILLYTKRSDIYSGYVTIGVLAPRFPGVDPDLHRGRNYDFKITIKYEKPNDGINLYGGGKRIKKIENISETGEVLTKEYEYVFPLNNDVGEVANSTSGGIIGLPMYLTKGISSGGLNIYTSYNDTSSSYGSYQPNSIGYSYVTEYQGTKQNNIGKIEYSFTNLSDSGGDYYEFPYHPPTDNEWLRGKNIRTKIFKNNGNGDYLLKKEIYNKYLYGNNEYTIDFNLPNLLKKDFVFTPEGTINTWEENAVFDIENKSTLFKLPLFMMSRYTGTSPNIVRGYRVYHSTGGTVNLKSTEEKNYLEGKELKTKTEYYYNYDTHYQVKRTEVTNSKGEVLKTINYYPGEVVSTSSLGHDNLTTVEFNDIKKLQKKTATNTSGQNRVATPVQVESYKNDNLLTTQRTNFLSQGTNLVLPKNVQTSIENGSLEDRVVYHSYDAKGNPTEVSKKDGTHIVYIWGYHQTQPVAKIENATLSQVSSYIGNIQTLSNADNDRTMGIAGNEGALRTALNALRGVSVLSKSQITTFTYDLLIGATSITDPRGQTVYYEYDDFNRLQFVKDKDGNILKETKYNYKN